MERSREIRNLDVLRRNVRGLYDVSAHSHPREVAATSAFNLYDRVVFSDFSFTPLHFDHNPDKLKEFDTDFLLLERYHSGEATGIVADAVTEVNPTKFHIVDWSRRYKCITTHIAGQSMMIPHKRVRYDPSRFSPYLSFDVASFEGRLLGVAFDQYCAAMRKGKSDEVSLCTELCIRLVWRLLRGNEERNKGDLMARVDAAQARSYIQRNLTDPELGSDKLCSELTISRASLYRLFADEGGVARYIDKLRLQRCFDALLEAPPQRGEVRRIAEMWGFYEPALFNRKFRRQFSMSPSDCLATERPQPSVDMSIGEVWPINQWLRKA